MPPVTVADFADAWRDPTVRARIEAEALPDFLRRQRWFAGKARGLASARFETIAEGAPVPDHMALAIVETTYEDSGKDRYFLPVAAVGLEAAGASADDPRWAIVRLQGSEGPGILLDAIADDRACRAFLDLIARGEAAGSDSAIRGVACDAFAGLRGADEASLEVHRSRAEQSNSAVIFGDRLILKVFRRPEPGVNPDFEIGRFLTDRTDFDRVPPTAGAIELASDGEEAMTLGILQGLVANEGSGWDVALAGLATFYEQVAETPAPPAPPETTALALALSGREPPEAFRSAADGALDSAATLGRRTAEMHRALASDPADPDFAPELLTPTDTTRLAEEAAIQVRSALEGLRIGLEKLPPEVAGQARSVVEGGPRLLAGLDRLAGLAPGSARIRVHGDYHLGQVLGVEEGDFVILDFEGEPARPLAARKRKESPIKDVVGMVRSFDYAAYAGLFAAGDRADRLVPWAELWSLWAGSAFVAAYLREVRGADPALVPDDPEALEALVTAYTLEKATYELHYELNNRPTWVRIPLSGIANLLGRSTS